ncbi:MAG: MFS transporter [Lachnospiraceae bacterium]
MKIKYCFLQGLYWMLFCAGGGFVTAYLVGIGVEASTVGVVTATFCALSALMQPVLGKLADKGRHFHWINQLKIMALITIVCNLILLVQEERTVSAILFGIILLCLNCSMPFVNGASFYYENRGYKMNFGVARGIGSLSYAFVSMILGKLMASMGEKAVCLTGLVIGVLLLLVIFLFHEVPLPGEDGVGFDNKKAGEKAQTADPVQEERGDVAANITSDGHSSMSQIEFVKRYPYFMLMLVGFLCLLAAHNIANTYLLQMVQRVGGGSEEMGLTLSLAAVLEIPVMFLVSSIVKRWPVNKLLLASGIFFTLKMVIYVFATNVYMIYAAQILQPFSYALFATVCVYFAQEVMDEENKLRGQTFVSSSITLGAVLGNLTGGVVVQNFGVGTMLQMSVVICLIGTVIIGLFHTKAVSAHAVK